MNRVKDKKIKRKTKLNSLLNLGDIFFWIQYYGKLEDKSNFIE